MSEIFGNGHPEDMPHSSLEDIANARKRLVSKISGLMDDEHLTEDERNARAAEIIERVDSGDLTIDSFKREGED